MDLSCCRRDVSDMLYWAECCLWAGRAWFWFLTAGQVDFREGWVLLIQNGAKQWTQSADIYNSPQQKVSHLQSDILASRSNRFINSNLTPRPLSHISITATSSSRALTNPVFAVYILQNAAVKIIFLTWPCQAPFPFPFPFPSSPFAITSPSLTYLSHFISYENISPWPFVHKLFQIPLPIYKHFPMPIFILSPSAWDVRHLQTSSDRLFVSPIIFIGRD